MSEIWIPIPQFEDYYSVSDLGRVKVNKSGRIKKSKLNKYGYININLSFEKKTFTFQVHRLVLLSFNPVFNSEYLVAHHINHIRSDNRLENLTWLLPSENQKEKLPRAKSYKIFQKLRRKYSEDELVDKLNQL